MNIKSTAKALKFAGLVARAGETVLVVMCEEHLEDDFLRIADALCIRMDIHAIPDLCRAGGIEAFLAGNLDGAKAAAGFKTLVFVIAKMRDIDTDFFRSFHDLRTFRYFNWNIVDGNFYHFHLLTHARIPPISKTSGKSFMAARSEFCAVSPRPHREVRDMTRAIFVIISMSSFVAVPLASFSRMILM